LIKVREKLNRRNGSSELDLLVTLSSGRKSSPFKTMIK